MTGQFGFSGKVFFIFTETCRHVQAGTSCDVASIWKAGHYPRDSSHIPTQAPRLGARIASRIDLGDATKLDLDELEELRNTLRRSGEALEVARAPIYIHCAPCACLIQTGLDICDQLPPKGMAKELLKFEIRVDAQLTASCCVAEGRDRVCSIVNSIRSEESAHGDRWPTLSYLHNMDRDWLDQRAYEYEEEMKPQETSDLQHILQYGSQWPSQVAGIIILGERDHLLPAVSKPPFKALKRTPRETQFFELKKDSHEMTYLGSYTPKPPLARKPGVGPQQATASKSPAPPQLPTTSAALQPSSQSSPTSLTVDPRSPKRQKTTSSTTTTAPKS